ncbi:MAG TPA: alginate export family protein [Geothrix sp.]|nr:alginate export family protein [Geothrix sp.]
MILRRFLTLLGLCAAPLLAQDAQPPLEFGFQERLRSEAWDNIIDHRAATPDLHMHYRIRTNAWVVVPLGEDLTFAAGLVNENRKVVKPDVAVNQREVIFDSFYLDWRMDPSWSLRAGRQTLMRGDGFVLWDGGALDGSRTAYVNAVDLAWTGGGTKVEFLGISDPARDRTLPGLNHTDNPKERQLLNERDEAALAVYGTWRRDGHDVQAYLFHKTERRDVSAWTDPIFVPDRWVETLGLRLAEKVGGGLSAMGEFTVQSGRQSGRPGTQEPSSDIRAWGGQAKVTQAFKVPLRPELSLGWVGLSGDDPSTRTNEGWDPVFSRWPKWSELYIYSQVPEGGVAMWSNLRMWEATVQAKPHPKLGLRASVFWMQAFQPVLGHGPIFASGLGRGRLDEVRADFALSDQWQGRLTYERLDPGTFYKGTDSGRFLQVDIVYTFRRRR